MSAQRSPITTHVLDVSLGRPAAQIDVRLAKLEGDHFGEVGRGATDADGRITTLLAPGSLVRGTYRLSFDVGSYFAASQRRAFYPHVEIVFVVTEPDQHHHVPLLLSPFGYSTYRGS